METLKHQVEDSCHLVADQSGRHIWWLQEETCRMTKVHFFVSCDLSGVKRYKSAQADGLSVVANTVTCGKAMTSENIEHVVRHWQSCDGLGGQDAFVQLDELRLL